MRNFAWKPALIALLMLASIYGLSPNFRSQDGPLADPYAGDFMQEWVGGYLVLRGERQKFYDTDYFRQVQHDPMIVGYAWNEGIYMPVVYPPFYYVAVSPLALLPMRTAAWIWAALMVAALVVSIRLTQRLAATRWGLPQNGPATPMSRILDWLLPLSLLYMPVIQSLTTSQKGSVCLLILTGTYALLAGGRPLAAGAFFGLLLFKPQLALVIGISLLVKGQWRFVVGCLLTATVLAGGSLVMGWDVCQQYATFLLGTGDYLQTAGYDLHESHCLRGFFTLLGNGQSIFGGVPVALAGLAIVGVLVRLLWGPLKTDTPVFVLQYSAMVVATILLSPHFFTYDLTILLLPMVLIACALEAGKLPRGRFQQSLGCLLVLLFAIPGFSSSLAQQTGIQLTVPLLAGLLVMLAMARRWVLSTE